MVEVDTGGVKTKAINRNYPAVEGLEAGTTKQEGTKTFLEPRISLVKENDKVGL